MKSLKDQIQAFVSKAHNNWDIYLSSVAYAYRTTVSSATGYTSHYALFGREAPITSEEWLWQFARRKGLTEHIRGILDALKMTWTGMGTRLEKKTGHPRENYTGTETVQTILNWTRGTT